MLAEELVVLCMSNHQVQLAFDLRNDRSIALVPREGKIERNNTGQVGVLDLVCRLADAILDLRKPLQPLGRNAELGAFDGAGNIWLLVINWEQPGVLANGSQVQLELSIATWRILAVLLGQYGVIQQTLNNLPKFGVVAVSMRLSN